MPRFVKKPVVTVGRNDWAVEVPRPPSRATHARMTLFDDLKSNGKPKVVTLPIQDFGCFKGVAGEFEYVRMNKVAGRWDSIKEEFKGAWEWDGNKVVGIEDLI